MDTKLHVEQLARGAPQDTPSGDVKNSDWCGLARPILSCAWKNCVTVKIVRLETMGSNLQDADPKLLEIIFSLSIFHSAYGLIQLWSKFICDETTKLIYRLGAFCICFCICSPISNQEKLTWMISYLICAKHSRIFVTEHTELEGSTGMNKTHYICYVFSLSLLQPKHKYSGDGEELFVKRLKERGGPKMWRTGVLSDQ